jgi:hypothetical protein
MAAGFEEERHSLLSCIYFLIHACYGASRSTAKPAGANPFPHRLVGGLDVPREPRRVEQRIGFAVAHELRPALSGITASTSR